MPTTFANTINGNDIFAARATADASGNNIASTYATQSSVSAIRQVPAAAAADENKVLGVTDAQGSVGWVQGGGADVHTITVTEWPPRHQRSIIFQLDGFFQEDWEMGGFIFTATRNLFDMGSWPDWQDEWTYNTIDATNGIYELVYIGSARDWNYYDSTDNWMSIKNLFDSGISGGSRPQVKILCIDLTGVTRARYLFENFVVYGNLNFYNTDSITDFSYVLCDTNSPSPQNPSSGTALGPLNLPSCTTMESAFSGYYMDRLTDVIPQITLPSNSAVNVDNVFAQQTNITGGVLDCYEDWSANPNITQHSNCFYNCGSSTAAAAELAQIPQSWGGTLVQ